MAEVSRPKAEGRPRLLYVITEDWFFVSHFLPMAQTALKLGFDVAVATRVAKHREAIEAEGIRVRPVQSERGRTGSLPVQIAVLARILREERPALVHCIALRSILAGGAAARRAGIRRLVLAPTGLGHLWSSTGPAAAAARQVVRFAVHRFRGPGTAFLFENHDDPTALGLAEDGPDRIAFVGGAGVDPKAFPEQPFPPPPPPFRLALVSRMLWPKGVGIAVEAVRIARGKGLAVELSLFGAPDPANPRSILMAQLQAWGAEPGIRWLGPVENVPAVWAAAHAAILPSHYREGIPRSLIEAMASGRPVVTTDVPGCREAVRDGVEGLIVPPQAPVKLAQAIMRLATDPELVRRMGAAARHRFEENYTTEIVTKTVAKVYRGLVPGLGAAG